VLIVVKRRNIDDKMGWWNCFSPPRYVMREVAFNLRCGAECFVIEIEVNGEKQTKQVKARTPAAARKTIRNEYREDIQILTVKRGKLNPGSVK
jgi:hypothetical protein